MIHTYDTAGTKTATLTVTYADGDTDSKTVQTADVPAPLFTNINADVVANVPLVLALTLGQPATFGTFAPSQDKDYTASTTASVIATAGSAQLSVSDRSTTAPGHLVNADYTLPSTLQARAASTKGTGGVFADVGRARHPRRCSPTRGAATDRRSRSEFKQHVGVSDALRAGKYSKTLTFTLSTTTP